MVTRGLQHSNGVASYVMNYYRALHGPEMRFDFLVIDDVGSPYYKEIAGNGDNVFLLPSYIKHPLKFFSLIFDIFKKSHYDVVHCNVVNSGVPVLAAAAAFNVPIRILHSHAAQNGDVWWRQLRNKPFSALALHFANKYIACSHKAGDGLFGKRKYRIIPNAINISRFRYSEVARNKIRGIENCGDKIVVMTVGRITTQKNPYFIVDIIRELANSKVDFRFWWFGDDELNGDVQRYAEKQGVSQYISFKGSVGNVNEYYSAADVFVLPSLYEGLPVSGVEAQTAGLPVLFSDQITRETSMSVLTEFLPIDNANLWAEKILLDRHYDRSNYIRSVVSDGFDIRCCSKQMIKEYSISM